MKDYYEILEVPPEASQEKIKEQYRFLVYAWHPDRFPNPGQKAKAEEKIKEVNETYQVLSNPTKRAQYDRERSAQSFLLHNREAEPKRRSHVDRVDHTWSEPFEKTLVNSIGMAFVPIPAGEFMMGSSHGDHNERPVHKVRISRPFYLAKYEVTQEQWQTVMMNNPSRYTGDANLPVEQVSWNAVQEFIHRLNAQEGSNYYRLPTEAEWEYAARAGSKTTYSFGDNARQLEGYAWYGANAGRRTHPVGQKIPNAWGLYDMHGNVREWVQDWYGPYDSKWIRAIIDPQGPSSGSGRIARGGCWIYDAVECGSANRYHFSPDYHIDFLGFRLLRTAP